jgi:ABC-type nitrate/sulfonate/bicarbonate transport system permease component
MFVVAIATVSSLEEFPSSYRAILHCHPAPPMRRLFMVTLPFLLPSIVLFIRVCLVISWGTLIHVESSGMRTGIGRIFAETYNANAMPAAHLCTVVLIVIAISIDVVVSAGCRHFPSALKWVDG